MLQSLFPHQTSTTSCLLRGKIGLCYTDSDNDDQLLQCSSVNTFFLWRLLNNQNLFFINLCFAPCRDDSKLKDIIWWNCNFLLIDINNGVCKQNFFLYLKEIKSNLIYFLFVIIPLSV